MEKSQGRHKPGCEYQALTDEFKRLNGKLQKSHAEVIESWIIQSRLGNIKLVGNTCPGCGIDQATNESSREVRSASFAN